MALAARIESGRQWCARPVGAASIRVAVLIVPIAASVGCVLLTARIVPPPSSSLLLYLTRWFGLSLLATLVLAGVGRLCRRLLPLAALLRLSLLFPDATPSRFRTAIASGTVATLEERLAEARRGDGTPGEAAQRLLTLVAALDRHDGLTRGHSERVRAYSRMIGRELGLDGHALELLNWAALLHDIGKLEVPQGVLNKRGRPSDEEWATIRRHPELGAPLVEPLRGWLGDWIAAVGDHHEHWDGGGYPYGLSRDEISLAGRIVAVADVFDVITSSRSYKSASSLAAGRAEIARCAGTQFDPDVVRAFLSVSLARSRFATGPLSWLAQASVLARTPLTTAAGTLSAAAAIGLAVAPGGIAAPGARSDDRTNAAPVGAVAASGAARASSRRATPAPAPPAAPRSASEQPTTRGRGGSQPAEDERSRGAHDPVRADTTSLEQAGGAPRPTSPPDDPGGTQTPLPLPMPLPELPPVPELPGLPGVPEVPELPPPPSAPSTPSAPSAPEVPVPPAVPSAPAALPAPPTPDAPSLP